MATGPNLSGSICNHVCNVVGNKIYVIGGRDRIDAVNYSNIIKYSSFNESTNTFDNWVTIENHLNTPRVDLRSVVFESNIYAIGMYCIHSETMYSTIRYKCICNRRI